MEIVEAALAVKINQTYRAGMSNEELYEITRGIWKVNRSRRNKIRYVFGVAHGFIKEVFEVSHWDDAGTTPYHFRKHDFETLRGRSEFVGKTADDRIRDKYVGKAIDRTFQTINYYNC